MPTPPDDEDDDLFSSNGSMTMSSAFTLERAVSDDAPARDPWAFLQNVNDLDDMPIPSPPGVSRQGSTWGFLQRNVSLDPRGHLRHPSLSLSHLASAVHSRNPSGTLVGPSSGGPLYSSLMSPGVLDLSGMRGETDIATCSIRHLYRSNIAVDGARGRVNNSVALSCAWIRHVLDKEIPSYDEAALPRLSRGAPLTLAQVMEIEHLDRDAWQLTPFLRSNLSQIMEVRYKFPEVAFERITLGRNCTSKRVCDHIGVRVEANLNSGMYICTLVNASNKRRYGFAFVSTVDMFYIFNSKGNYTAVPKVGVEANAIRRHLRKHVGVKFLRGYGDGSLAIYRVKERANPLPPKH